MVGDGGLDLLETDRLLAPALRQQHLRRAGFVDHVDRLVRQLAVVDVARGQFHRRLDRLGGVFELVIILEIGLEALEDLDGVGNRRLVDVDLLESAHQRAVFLEILPVFLVGGRADAERSVPEASAGLSRFEASMAPPEVAPRADHGVDLIDEHDRARKGLELLDHLLETLLEVAAVARAGEQGSHVEGEHGRILEHVRHFAMHDPAREPFGDRGLATPASPTNNGLFFFAAGTAPEWCGLISASRPISGSILPSRAFLLRLMQ